MNKTEVYSWRLSSHLKCALEETARRERTSVAALIERIVAGWLAQERAQNTETDAQQARLQEAAARTLGVIRGGNHDRSTSVQST